MSFQMDSFPSAPRPHPARSLPWLLGKIRAIGADPGDSEELCLRKQMFATTLALVMPAALFWGGIYLRYNERPAALISFGYTLLAAFSLAVIAIRRRIGFFIPLHITAGLLLPFAQALVLGGFAPSGGVVLWSLLCPLAAVFHYRIRELVACSAAYGLLLVAILALEPLLRPANHLPPMLINILFALNSGGVSIIVLLTLNYFVHQRNEAYRLLALEQEKTEALLLNVLPKEVAQVLKNENRTIAQHYPQASVLFADLVGFTPLTAQMAPIDVVNLLNEIFSYFDSLAAKYDVEKIRTIGDSYMAAAGVPRPRPDHAHALACMALEMRAYLLRLPPVDGRPIQFRIGLNSGPMVGGVIGRKKFVFDLWGDAVNIASRLESHGEPNQIQIGPTTAALLERDFICQPRGPVTLKGRGEVAAWFLIAAR